MTTTSSATDYLTSRPIVRTHPSVAAVTSPRTPRTPLLGRSISSSFGSPGVFRGEQEDHIIYELGPRHLSAGFSGESKPRCTIRFDPDFGRRVGDYRQYAQQSIQRAACPMEHSEWTREYELYTTDIRRMDLGLFEDKLERAARQIHIDALQLDSKSRKAVLVISSLLPLPLLDVVIKVLFNHFAQFPTITILTEPILACVGAGLRDALVVDLGWEETVVTAVGEHKSIEQRRSVRAGRMFTREMAKTVIEAARNAGHPDMTTIGFSLTQEIATRMAWCRSQSQPEESGKQVKIPFSPSSVVAMLFSSLAEPAESIIFGAKTQADHMDDHELTIPDLMYHVMLKLRPDLRASCLSRIVITGELGALPGLRKRLLQEVSDIIASRGWDPVNNYGSATSLHRSALRERDSNVILRPVQKGRQRSEGLLDEKTRGAADALPASERGHDDVKDPITLKAERRSFDPKKEVATPRIVETVGAWGGASLLTSLRVKGEHELERDDYLKHGLRDLASVIF